LCEAVLELLDLIPEDMHAELDQGKERQDHEDPHFSLLEWVGAYIRRLKSDFEEMDAEVRMLRSGC
jgi:hypothetical protein